VIPKEKLQDELHQMTQAMTVEELEKAIKLLESLLGYQTMEEALANPRYDNEPWTEEDEEAVREAKKDIEKGEVYDWEDLKRELGLNEVNNN
jgi:dihydrodipicolinate synthase/N-acetylneuraminate lyase